MSTFRQSGCGPAATKAVAATPVSFVAGDFTGARQPYFRMQIQDNDMFVTYDGTTPGAANGELVKANSVGYFLREDLLAMKFVQVTANGRVFAQPCDLISPSNG